MEEPKQSSELPTACGRSKEAFICGRHSPKGERDLLQGALSFERIIVGGGFSKVLQLNIVKN